MKKITIEEIEQENVKFDIIDHRYSSILGYCICVTRTQKTLSILGEYGYIYGMEPKKKCLVIYLVVATFIYFLELKVYLDHLPMRLKLTTYMN